MAFRKRNRLRQAIGKQSAVWQAGKKVAFGFQRHFCRGVLGHCGDCAGANGCYDELLIRLSKFCIGLLPSLRGQLRGVLASIGHLFAGKNSGLALGES
jgi:hypothetical protein